MTTWLHGLRWVGEQVKHPDVQEVWREQIVRPCLDSILKSIVNEYLDSIVTAIAVWTCLLAVLMCIMVHASKNW